MKKCWIGLVVGILILLEQNPHHPAARVMSAPIPIPKARPSLVGHWYCDWGYTLEFETILGKDGSWYQDTLAIDDSYFYGSWRLDGDILHISEAKYHRDGTYGMVKEYCVALDSGKTEGQFLPHGGKFKLTKRKEKE